MEDIRICISELVTFYNISDREAEGVTVIETHIMKQVGRDDISDKDKAYMLNQLQKMKYGLEDYQSCVEILSSVIRLAPKDTSYLYNLSLVREKMKSFKEAAEAIERCMELDEEDNPGHIDQAIDIYLNLNDVEKVRVLYERYVSADADAARWKLMNDSTLRRTLNKDS
jgi:tetratricopeptide (TPR) repeat protein